MMLSKPKIDVNGNALPRVFAEPDDLRAVSLRPAGLESLGIRLLTLDLKEWTAVAHSEGG
jgi:hypothetical protein